jgi:flagellar basal-body rod protein FlgB
LGLSKNQKQTKIQCALIIWRAPSFWRGHAGYVVEKSGIGSGGWRALGGVAMLDPIAGRIERYMDLLSARQKLVASNIANADTPGYRTQDIDFQAEFQNAVGGPPRPTGVMGLAVKNDGNDVSVDRESRLLSENALRFNLASNLMRSQLRLVRSAIEEGKSS